MLLAIYAAQSLIVFLTLCILCYINKEDTDYEVLYMVIILTIFSPFAMIGFSGYILYDKVRIKRSRRAGQILYQWQRIAHDKILKPPGLLWPITTKDELHTRMREVINLMSSEDLDFLSTIGKDVYDIDKPVRDAIISELVDRELFE